MTLVFIHGAGALPSVFNAQADAFPECIVASLPGHGIPGSAASIGDFADDLARTLKSLRLRNVVLAGHSMGGAIALEMALRGNAALSGLVLLGGGARMRVASQILEGLRTDFLATAEAIARSMYAAPSDELRQATVRQMETVGQEQTIRDFASCNAFDVRERLGELTVPLLAITGSLDVMMPPKLAQEAASRVNRGEARIVEGAGHMIMVERPDDTNDLLRAFVTHTAA